LVWITLRTISAANKHRAVLVEAVVYVVGITSSYWLFERLGVLF
jgi:hypothetical protein